MLQFLVIESATQPVDKPKEEVSAQIAPMKNVEPIPPPAAVPTPPGEKKTLKKNAKATKDKAAEIVQPMDVSAAIAVEPKTVAVEPVVAEKPTAPVQTIVEQKTQDSAAVVTPQAEAGVEKANLKKGKGKKNKKE